MLDEKKLNNNTVKRFSQFENKQTKVTLRNKQKSNSQDFRQYSQSKRLRIFRDADSLILSHSSESIELCTSLIMKLQDKDDSVVLSALEKLKEVLSMT